MRFCTVPGRERNPPSPPDRILGNSVCSGTYFCRKIALTIYQPTGYGNTTKIKIVCSRVTTGELLSGFLYNFILGSFTEICHYILILVKIG
jgi:hypothetical protein